MELNDTISQKIWDGSIPVSFCISPSEITHELPPPPPPFLMLVPRVTYFALVLEKAIPQFYIYLQSNSRVSDTHPRSDSNDDSSPAHSAEESHPTRKEVDYWLSYDGVPLKWQEYPTDILLAPPVSRSAVEAVFIATLKEADQLKHRGRGGLGPIFDGLLPAEQHRLWNGLLQHRFDVFWSINKRFMLGAPAPIRPLPQSDPLTDSTGDDTENSQTTRIFAEDAAALMVATGAMKAFRHCPFRLYFSPHTFDTSPPTMTYLQTLVSPFSEVDGTPVTFFDVITTLLKCSNVQLRAEDFIFLVHGVEVPSETPAQWMCEWMAYPDNFVHVVACKRQE
ncbi:unnamed protein product [Hydatigera taeniaeformis]|uniref:Autophagy protein 5 n=1 Tax=Hydatigena taeniaeformis TaxID=6205 RepID=A0A0R3WP21_HYDTA|nr:unnamed protein product [Hydatigera taeniaeformis]